MTLMNHIVYLSSDEDDEKPKSIAHRKSNLSDPTVEDDDDCVVLDGDPYKTTAKESTVDTSETDDVLVVGQKGEIACRDYPHSRHACAKYPFNSTPHQNYCEMCHCYVCDTRAPCAYWFKGFSNIDHCHANDKDRLWKNQRECIRTGKLPPLPIAQLHRPQKSTCYAPPAASQGYPHRVIPGYSSTVPYAGQYRPIMYSGNVQTSAAIPSQTPNPWVNQQQQQHSGKNNDKLLSALEDWLMDPSTLSGQYNTTTPAFDYGTFLE